jgi:hypothetical protein
MASPDNRFFAVKPDKENLVVAMRLFETRSQAMSVGMQRVSGAQADA